MEGGCKIPEAPNLLQGLAVNKLTIFGRVLMRRWNPDRGPNFLE